VVIAQFVEMASKELAPWNFRNTPDLWDVDVEKMKIDDG
jgi:hypothetical protein